MYLWSAALFHTIYKLFLKGDQSEILIVDVESTRLSWNRRQKEGLRENKGFVDCVVNLHCSGQNFEHFEGWYKIKVLTARLPVTQTRIVFAMEGIASTFETMVFKAFSSGFCSEGNVR